MYIYNKYSIYVVWLKSAVVEYIGFGTKLMVISALDKTFRGIYIEILTKIWQPS